MGERQSGMLKDAESGILYMDNVQYLDGGLLREIASYSGKPGRKGLLIASCTPNAQPAQEEFQSEFPIVITMPRITERPIEERMEMIQTLFSTEASRVGRELVVKEELMRCLLLYECPENFQQLKRDIKIGCANAYVRELANDRRITLYVSDFEPTIRQGMSRFGQMREEIERLIPENSTFTFDGSRMRVSETETKNIYKELRQKAKQLESEGIEDEDIKMLLSTEVERAFGKYQQKLIHEVRSRKELELIVDEELIDMVERFLAKVENARNKKIDDAVFFGLCLHMKNVVNGTKTTESMDRLEISEVVTKYKQEYMLSLAFAEEIQEVYGRQLTIDEVILITMFLCYEPPKQTDKGQTVILYAFYGKDIAASIVRKLYSLESSNKTLYDITTKDPLTGAYNFETFKKKAQKLLTQTTKKYSLSYVDFADFKYINDVFGYKYGDEILINYAATISNELRTGEVLGRVSADNFVILRYYNEKNDIMVRQQQVDIKITEFMHDMYGGQAVSVQCGICYLEDLAEDLQIEGILDRANYARKTVKTGLNRKYAVYDESIRKQLRYEKSIENRMLKSLENEEFLVYFQPKVDLQTGLATQAEALVRWQTDEGLIIPPDKFIPIFEKKYLISSLDQYVFKKVCAFIRRRLDAGLPVNTISVNVSRLQFYNSDFVKTYEDIKNKFRIPDHLLEIEITESIAFDNVTFLEKTVSELKSKGFLISIDDFGTGFSSLSLLKNIPIDVLKIDQSFFRESIHKEKDNIVIKGIIDLVNKLSIRTVAEGIETAEQVAFLKSVNCNMIQGYFFYRPLPEDKFEAILNKEYAVKETAPATDSKVLAAENWTLQNN